MIGPAKHNYQPAAADFYHHNQRRHQYMHLDFCTKRIAISTVGDGRRNYGVAFHVMSSPGEEVKSIGMNIEEDAHLLIEFSSDRVGSLDLVLRALHQVRNDLVRVDESVSTETDTVHQQVWLCKRCNHALGVIRRSDNHAVLDVFRVAQRSKPFVMEYAITSLESGTLLCSNCHSSQKWHLSDTAIDRLIARRRKRSFGLD
jgi:hypothetical protein